MLKLFLLPIVFAASLIGPIASAAINKCTAPDGKVVFSDQPCASSQAQTIIKSAKPVGQAVPKDQTDGATARVRASLSPKCQVLAEKMASLFQEGATQAQDADITNTVTRYKTLCEPVIRKAAAAEEARQAADKKRVTLDLECQTKKRAAQETRTRPGGVTEGQKPALAALEESIARDCS